MADAIIDDFAPRRTQAELAIILPRRMRQGVLTMTADVYEENGGGFYTVFTFYDREQKFATYYHPGDWREDGSEASSVYSCFKEFFKIQERGRE